MAFFFTGDLLSDYTNLELIATISTMETFQKIYRPEIYNANSAAGQCYQPDLNQQDHSLTKIVYDREERSLLAIEQGKYTEERFIKPYKTLLEQWSATLHALHFIPDKRFFYENMAPDIDGRQPAETFPGLAQPETLWSPWKLPGRGITGRETGRAAFVPGRPDSRRIDIVSDGEQTRQHFVTTFIEHLSGVDFANRQTVRIRNRYDASVPTVVDAVAPETGVC